MATTSMESLIESGDICYGTFFAASARNMPLSFACDAGWYDGKTADFLSRHGDKGWYAIVSYNWHEAWREDAEKRLVAVGGPYCSEDEAIMVAEIEKKEMAKRLKRRAG